MNRMRKTKIVCTLGPSTDREDVLRDMILSGMNVARFNFSHGTHEEHKRRLDTLKRLREELNQPVAALLDTKGPEIRLKQFAGGKMPKSMRRLMGKKGGKGMLGGKMPGLPF